MSTSYTHIHILSCTLPTCTLTYIHTLTHFSLDCVFELPDPASQFVDQSLCTAPALLLGLETGWHPQQASLWGFLLSQGQWEDVGEEPGLFTTRETRRDPITGAGKVQAGRIEVFVRRSNKPLGRLHLNVSHLLVTWWILIPFPQSTLNPAPVQSLRSLGDKASTGPQSKASNFSHENPVWQGFFSNSPKNFMQVKRSRTCHSLTSRAIVYV